MKAKTLLGRNQIKMRRFDLLDAENQKKAIDLEEKKYSHLLFIVITFFIVLSEERSRKR